MDTPGGDAVPSTPTTTVEMVEDSGDEEGGEEGDENAPRAQMGYNPWMRNETLAKVLKEQDQEEAGTEGQELAKVSDTITLRPQLNRGKEGEDEEESDLEEREEQRQLIAEAFAEDDIVRDFEEEKKAVIDKEKDKDVDMFLPGWGSWGGKGIKQSKARRSKFIIKAPQKRRRDDHLGNVIISEKKSAAIAKFMPKHLPFPYKNVEEYEKSLQHPIGNTWNPEQAFRGLIEPRVVTKLGTVIEPMDETSLPKDKQNNRRAKNVQRKGKGKKERKGQKKKSPQNEKSTPSVSSKVST
jgi:U3 small nucleolar RNA-associated protein 14